MLSTRQPQPHEASSIRNIVVSGGGANNLALAGCLYQLVGAPGFSFDNIIRLAGTSAGSLAALALALKLTPEETIERLAAIDPKKIKDLGSWLDLATYKRIFTLLKLYKGEVIFLQVLKLLSDITGRNDPDQITFQDLKEMGYKDLYIITTECSIINMQEGQGETKVYSFERTPHAPVAWVIRASTAAPPYFPGVMFKCDEQGYYTVLPPNTNDPDARLNVDGAFSCNFGLKIFDYPKYMHDGNTHSTQDKPLEILHFERPNRIFDDNWSEEDKACVQTIANPQTLGFALCWPSDAKKTILHPGKPISEIEAAFNALFAQSHNNLLGDYENFRRTILTERLIALTDFDIDEDTQRKVILAGAKAVSRYYNIPMAEESLLSLVNFHIDERSKRNKKLEIPLPSLNASSQFLMWGCALLPAVENKPTKESTLSSSPCSLM